MRREFEFSLPPSVNQLYPGRVKRHKSDKYHSWEQQAGIELREQNVPVALHAPTTHRWTLDVECLMASRRADMDNTIKAGVDFIARWFALDDRYLDELHILRLPCLDGGPRWKVRLDILGA